MQKIYFLAVPFDKNLVTLALESGVDGLIVEDERVESVRQLGRTEVLPVSSLTTVCLESKADEEHAVACLRSGGKVVLRAGWEIIPVENILAQADKLGVEVASLDQARLAAGILEHGVDWLLVLPQAATELKSIVAEIKLSQGVYELSRAVVTEVRPVGLGHRVCVDTLSMLRKGQGMLVGNGSAFTFLVHAETENNPYVAARPFRVNAGAVHAYAIMPGDRTNYLQELSSGDEVLVVGHDGRTSLATIGRVKVEVRPMLLVRARVDTPEGPREGAVFLQNAETIRLTRPGGEPVSVVSLREGDEILVRLDTAGRHFGMRISEDIKEA
ncbi:3-dehydroquinate synthase II family protein [Desulfocurvibacter africanus]|uniref:3-dehydroquinate synthase n=2 Tax=Desulfocurvibacter africanus TaxID=873 RepID=F3Z2P4_DESAF|nr:3-dehydroquinate synthase II family protein [Desulfocurvibacter africanus]EGJ50211.1 3-dehydroquinate synthase [Desulfocurvibacter africanus subsp. africanus str. Walvis Bay]